jgi:hypothetical protein
MDPDGDAALTVYVRFHQGKVVLAVLGVKIKGEFAVAGRNSSLDEVLHYRFFGVSR